MSVNRPGRGSGKARMKRAYLNAYSSDRSPKGGKPRNKDVVKEYTERLDSVARGEQLPLRKQIQTGEHSLVTKRPETTPTITFPYKQRVKALHREWAGERNVYRQVLARTPFELWWLCFDGFDTRSVYWIECLIFDTQMLRISYNGSKDDLMDAVRGKRGKVVVWKDTVPYVGKEQR